MEQPLCCTRSNNTPTVVFRMRRHRASTPGSPEALRLARAAVETLAAGHCQSVIMSSGVVPTAHGPLRPRSAPATPKYVFNGEHQMQTARQSGSVVLPLSTTQPVRRGWRPASAKRASSARCYTLRPAPLLSYPSSQPAESVVVSSKGIQSIGTVELPEVSPALRRVAADARLRLEVVLSGSVAHVLASPPDIERSPLVHRARTLLQQAADEYERELLVTLHTATKEQASPPPPAPLHAGRPRPQAPRPVPPRPAQPAALRQHLASWRRTVAASGAILAAAEAVHAAASAGQGGAHGFTGSSLGADAIRQLNVNLLAEAEWIHVASRNALLSSNLRREIAVRLKRRVPDPAALAASLAAVDETPIDRMVSTLAHEIIDADESTPPMAAVDASRPPFGGDQSAASLESQLADLMVKLQPAQAATLGAVLASSPPLCDAVAGSLADAGFHDIATRALGQHNGTAF